MNYAPQIVTIEQAPKFSGTLGRRHFCGVPVVSPWCPHDVPRDSTGTVPGQHIASTIRFFKKHLEMRREVVSVAGVTGVAYETACSRCSCVRAALPVAGLSTVAGFIGDGDGAPGQTGERRAEVFAVAAPNQGFAGAGLRCRGLQRLWLVAGWDT